MSDKATDEGDLDGRVKAVAKALSQDEETAAKLRLWGFSVAEIAASTLDLASIPEPVMDFGP